MVKKPEDIGIIIKVYETDRNLGREKLWNMFPMVFKDSLNKKQIMLRSQELYSSEDVMLEAYQRVDTLFCWLVENGYNKPIFKKKKIIGCKEGDPMGINEQGRIGTFTIV